VQAEHSYAIEVEWTGNLGQGTAGYTTYSRQHEISVVGKPVIPGSSDPNFRGDPSRYNPEEMLVASLSACHMLWYLHLCADAGITVLAYCDHATGLMVTTANGAGQFERVNLQPSVTIARAENIAKATELHAIAHARCFIANSVNFRVTHQPIVKVQPKEAV
jgi:organic hydroperoxide reductase OsmC/OhrA